MIRGWHLPHFSSLYTFLTQENRATQEIQVLLVIPLIGTLIHIKQMTEERCRAEHHLIHCQQSILLVIK